MVRLEEINEQAHTSVFMKFQFHYGSIGRGRGLLPGVAC